MTKKQQRMTREEASALYDSLRKTMESKYGKKELSKLIAQEKKKGAAKPAAKPAAPAAGAARMSAPRAASASGTKSAVLFVILVACVKLSLSVLEAAGIGKIEDAQATMAPRMQTAAAGQFSHEEVQILTALDQRRAELEERREKLESREHDLDLRDREFADKLTKLRDVSEQLKGDREKIDRKRFAQLDQLASVYGSMKPEEAAELMEQLDVMIALSLIERMPEKRIAQILALMSPEKALSITRMLSEKGE